MLQLIILKAGIKSGFSKLLTSFSMMKHTKRIKQFYRKTNNRRLRDD